MTPQELIDLPGYGSAKKQLRKQGNWQPDSRDKLEDFIGDLEYALDDAKRAQENIEDVWRDMSE